jgi:hypothetical protein
MLALRPCPRQAVHIEVFLQRSFRKPETSAGLSAARVYLAILARQPQKAQDIFEDLTESDRLRCPKAIMQPLEDLVGYAQRVSNE